MRACLATDVVNDDRRPGMTNRVVGVDGYAQMMIATSDVGVTTLESMPLAIRSDHLALLRVRALGRAGADGFQTEFLSVQEADDEGRISSQTLFDPVDLQIAVAELDARWIAGDGADAAVPSAILSTLVASYNDRDWDGVRSICTDDFVFIDRTPAARGELDLEGYVESYQAIVDLTEAFVTITQSIEVLTGTGGVGRVTNIGTTLDGSPFELSYACALVFRDGLISRMELFPADRLDAALARFAELTTDPHTAARPDTLAVRTLRAMHNYIIVQDWDQARLLMADDLVVDDRRLGVGVVTRSAEAHVEQLKTFASVGVRRIDIDVIATRGESLALCMVLITGSDVDAFATEMLCVHAVHPDGRGYLAIGFEPDDLDAAFAELDRLHLESEEALVDNEAARLGARFHDCYDRRDWDGLAALFSADSVLEDRRKGVQSTITGRDVRAANMAEMAKIGAVRIVTTPIAARGDHLVIHRFFVSGPEESGFSAEFLQMDELDDEGLLATSILFDVDDLPVALSELDSGSTAGPIPFRRSRRMQLSKRCTGGARFSRAVIEKHWQRRSPRTRFSLIGGRV